MFALTGKKTSCQCTKKFNLNLNFASRQEDHLPVYQPPKKEEVILTYKDFYPVKPVEVNTHYNLSEHDLKL